MTLFSIDHLAQSDYTPSTNRFVSHPEMGLESPSRSLPRPSSTGSSGSDAGSSDDTGSSWESASEASLPSSPPARSTKKPPHSYISLIAMAILNSPDKRLLLCDIYEYIMKRFPFFKDNERSWRNSIRHNLSLNECFVKAGRSGDGRGHFWAIHPINVDDFARGDYRRRRARRRARAATHASTPYAYPSTIPSPVGFVPMTYARLSEIFPAGTHMSMLPSATPYSSLPSPAPVPVPTSHYLHTPVLRPDVSARLPTQISSSPFPGSFPSIAPTTPRQLSTLEAAHRWVPHASTASHLIPANFAKMPCPPTLMSTSSAFTPLRSACTL